MTETAVATSKAMVYNYDATTKGWVQKGKGISRLDLYYNAPTNSYRVIGRTLQDNEVVLNAAYFKGMNYSKASDQFYQWTDTRGAYGLNFAAKDEADKFLAATNNALQKLNSAGAPPPPSPSPTPPSPAPAPAPTSPPTPAPRSIAPSAPPAPTGPPAAPSSPSSMGGPPPPPPSGGPPPPPPPGPPSAPAAPSGGGLSLAEQLAKAKLRKTEPPPESPSLGGGVVGATTNSTTPATETPAPAPRPSGGFDMMSELQKKLAKKIAIASAPPPLAPGTDTLEAPGTPKGPPPPLPSFGAPAAPLKAPAPKTSFTTATAKVSNSGDDLDSLRQELRDLKEELRAFKAEMSEKFKQFN